MTTIVFDGTTLACDSQTTIEGEGKCSSCDEPGEQYLIEKKLFVDFSDKTCIKNQRVLAAASYGLKAASMRLLKLLQKGLDLAVALDVLRIAVDPAGQRNDPSGGLFVLTDTSAWTVTLARGRGTLVEVDRFPLILGSGTGAVQTFLKLYDLSVVEAAIAATFTDPRSRGPVWSCTRETAAQGGELAAIPDFPKFLLNIAGKARHPLAPVVATAPIPPTRRRPKTVDVVSYPE